MRHEWDILPGESDDARLTREVSELSAAFETADAQDVFAYAWERFGTRLGIVSSFGAESVVLLHLAASIDRSVPVIFVDTHMLFAETLAYQTDVASHLGLIDVRRVSADATVLRLSDPKDALHKSAPDDCCHLRKTLPLETALLTFEAWATGRKRHQTAARSDMQVFEVDGQNRIKVNPLANWTPQQIAGHLDAYDLPRHPLVERGFSSIGCGPCTTPTQPGEDPRSGRWRNHEKTECGIHFSPDGAIKRGSVKAA